jgi:hypothetical protein
VVGVSLRKAVDVGGYSLVGVEDGGHDEPGQCDRVAWERAGRRWTTLERWW